MKWNVIERMLGVAGLVVTAGVATGQAPTGTSDAGTTRTYENPVIREANLADPAVLLHEGTYYMYPTGGGGGGYHVYTSKDLVNWERGERVFQIDKPRVWAPDVYYHPEDGKFYLYYTQDWKVGVAVAESPRGPFEDKGILATDVIDGHLFRDEDGALYLFYTSLQDIYVHKMKNPLEVEEGARKSVISPELEWEMQDGHITEGPWVLKHEGRYYLIYSGSGANSPHYAIGYATAEEPVGPYTKYEGNPIIRAHDNVYGPGHGSVTRDAAGNLWHVHHQKRTPEISFDRFIAIDPLWFDEEGVLHGRATRGTRHPAPAVAE